MAGLPDVLHLEEGLRVQPTPQQCLYLAWVGPVEDQHNEEHKHRVEDVQIHLVPEQISIIALEVFDNAENRSDHDEQAGDVQSVHVLLPGHIPRQRSRGGDLVEAPVEDRRCDDEETEEDELDEETAYDEILASGNLIVSASHETAACELRLLADLKTIDGIVLY